MQCLPFVVLLVSLAARGDADTQLSDDYRLAKLVNSLLENFKDSQKELWTEVKSKLDELVTNQRRCQSFDALREEINHLRNEIGHIPINKKAKKSQSCELLFGNLTLTTLASRKYYFSSHLLSWHEAYIFCKNINMEIASPKNQHELDLVYIEGQKLSPYSHSRWLSATDVGRAPGDFYWHDGEALAGNSSLWASGKPNSFKANEKTCVYLHGRMPKLADYQCSSLELFVCELPTAFYCS